jgi:predicted aminopeptidase
LKNSLRLAVLAGMAFLLQGCYLLKQAGGQFDLRWRQVPLAVAIEQTEDPELRQQLMEIPRITTFAVDRLQLNQSDNYTTYYATDREAIAWVVTAAPQDRLEPYTWWFPIIGSVPYLGFFQAEDAEALVEQLKHKGYDVWMFGATAYSTLGWFRDPVTTPMLRRDLYSLADVIIHEMTHETLYVKGEGDFNEQLATFVGEQGALQFFQETGRLTPIQLKRIEARKLRQQAVHQAVKAVITELEALYRVDVPKAELLEKRQAIFDRLADQLIAVVPGSSLNDWVFNNARLLQYRRYEPASDLMQTLWDRSEHDWGRFWTEVRSYAESNF